MARLAILQPEHLRWARPNGIPGVTSAGRAATHDGWFMTGPHRHPYYEICILLEGRAFGLQSGPNWWRIEAPAMVVVQPDTEHCEGWIARNQSHCLFWCRLPVLAPLFYISTYNDRVQRWNLLARQPVAIGTRHRIVQSLDAFAGRNAGFEQVQAEFLRGLAETLCHRIDRKNEPFSSVEVSGSNHLSVYVEAIQSFCDAHMDHSLSLAELSNQFGLTSNHLDTVFSRGTGMGVHQYLIQVRMTKAMELCRHSDCLIKQIAAQVGYTDPLYFSRAFHRYHGMSPKQAREAANTPNIP